jgi:single-stranded-DNA-specific exonuclease
MPPAVADPVWIINRTNQEYLGYISRATGLSMPVAQTLINRGVRTPEQIKSFLDPVASRLSDPYELSGMEAAVARISTAVKNKERILVHGDYDADGVTATAILVEAVNRLGGDVIYHIPNRAHGYGMGNEGVKRASEAGASLIVSVDCGITSFEAVSSARAFGIDVVVTDHHEPLAGDGYALGALPRFTLPEAVAIINPAMEPGGSPWSALSGAGIAFKLAQALLGNSMEAARDLFDLAGLGTAADVVPLVGDNRIIVKEGCDCICSGTRVGVAALKQAAGIKTSGLKVSAIQFMMVPRINAAGRIDDANDAVRLLLTESASEALRLAEWLNDLNVRRQAVGESVYEQAMEMIRSSGAGERGDGAIVVGAEGWHPGVIGIVASRIAETFYRPAFVFSMADGTAKGSARSIPPFDIHAGLRRCGHILKSYGGHKQAAGLSLAVSDLDLFRETISRIFFETVTGEDLTPTLRIDSAMRISEISSALLAEIASLEPFGHSNEEPVFGAKRLEMSKARVVGGRHLRMFLSQSGRGMDGIGFGLGGMLDRFSNGDLVDIAFLPVMNEWEGGRSAQLNVRALRASVNGI